MHVHLYTYMVLNIPISAVKVNPIATADFIFTVLRSRLFVFSCSSCRPSFLEPTSPSCSFLRSTGEVKGSYVNVCR